MAHSTLHTVLQQHSIGPLYPWTIAVVKQLDHEGGACQPIHCLTGCSGPRFEFDDWESFDGSHLEAETWIRNRG